jgi:hypothetical protein
MDYDLLIEHLVSEKYIDLKEKNKIENEKERIKPEVNFIFHNDVSLEELKEIEKLRLETGLYFLDSVFYLKKNKPLKNEKNDYKKQKIILQHLLNKNKIDIFNVLKIKFFLKKEKLKKGELNVKF